MIGRRALLAGLLASISVPAVAQRFARRGIVAQGGFRFANPAVPRINWLDDGGASAGLWYGENAGPAWVYDAARNWIVGGVSRFNYNAGTLLKENTAVVYDLATQTATLGGVMMTDDSAVTGTADVHGVVGMAYDQYGFLHAYGGGHNAAMKHSVSLDGGLTWTARGTFGTTYTYAHPVQVGNDQLTIAREAPGGGTYPLIYHRGTAINATTGAMSFGAKLPLVNLQTDTRVYAGNPALVGTDLYIPFCRANEADSIRIDVYVGVLDTTTGALRNLSSSISTASGSLPILRATADASYRLVDQTTGGTEEGNTPGLFIDAEGLHLLYQGGVGGLTLFHALYSLAGALLEGPTNIATVSGRYATSAIGPRPGGGVEVLFPKVSTINDYDTNAPFSGSGGDLWRTERPAGGVWVAATLLQAVTPVHSLGNPTRINGAPASFRFAYSERARTDDTYATGGNLRTFGWGSGGLVTTPFVEDPDAAAQIGGATYSDADRIILTSAFRGMKTSGWWTRGDLTYFQAEPVESVARKNAFGGYTLTDIGTGNVHTPYSGLKGSAASKFDTGWNPTAVTGKRMGQNSVFLGVGCYENTTSTSWDIGSGDATVVNILFNARNSSDLQVTRLSDASSTPTRVANSAKYLAFAIRPNSTTKRLYSKAVANITAGTITSAALPNATLQLGGNTTSFQARGQALMFIGAAMGDPGPITQVWKRYLHDRGVL